MSEPRVLVRDREKKAARAAAPPDADSAWRWIGAFGLVLAVVGLADFALAWYPMSFGTPEWEFATVTASYSGLPLPTMGLTALIASAIARGVRWQILLVSVGLLVLALFLIGGYLLFLTTVPVALGAVEGVPLIGIRKAIVKTSLLAIAFGGTYLTAAIVGFRHVRRAR